MSFHIQLQHNDSPSNKVDKDLTLVQDLNGALRDESSILNPIFTFQTNVPENVMSKINYATIPDFNRSYFVTELISVNTDLWEIHMHVDVLMTYREQLRRQKGIVARQASQYNLYLDDGWFQAYQNPIIQTKLFSAATPFETQEFVLVVAGS